MKMEPEFNKLEHAILDLAIAKGIKTPLYDWDDHELNYHLVIMCIHRWLMKEHNIHVIATPKILYPDNAISNEYYYSIYKEDVGLLDSIDGVYWGYYEALYEGILEVLNFNLI